LFTKVFVIIIFVTVIVIIIWNRDYTLMHFGIHWDDRVLLPCTISCTTKCLVQHRFLDVEPIISSRINITGYFNSVGYNINILFKTFLSISF
jgi:hypothetical protein